MDSAFVVVLTNFQRLCFGFQSLFGGNEAIFFHALNDVELARTSTLRIADGVVSGRRFGQAREHGGFSNGDVLKRFAKISFRSGSKAIGAVA